MPAHNHGTTITQPAFSTPKFTHTITQPVFTVTKGGITNGITGGSHTHNLKYGGLRYSSVASGAYDIGGGEKEASETTVASTHTHNLPDHSHTVTRTTNVGVSDHAATACSRSTDVAVTVNNNTASNASAAHENMPPYLAVYTWKRVA